jgi:PhoD related phosphatase
MSGRILAAPFLGLEGDTAYTVCFLTSKDTENPQVIVDEVAYPPEQLQETPSGVLWHAAITVQVEHVGRFHRYHVRSTGVVMQDPRNRSEWEFWVPGNAEEPRIAYTSCNGFSDGDAKTKFDEPYGLWKRMVEDHGREPFALLIMGGDQLYADEIWHSRRRAPSVVAWSGLGRAQRLKHPTDARLQRELDRFYEDLYIRHWNQAEMSLMMASVPSLMM